MLSILECADLLGVGVDWVEGEVLSGRLAICECGGVCDEEFSRFRVVYDGDRQRALDELHDLDVEFGLV